METQIHIHEMKLTAYNPPAPVNAGYMFETVFDFCDHDENIPTPIANKDWLCRLEPFSDFHAGFEIRTYRLCKRILFFHYFKELNDGINRGAMSCSFSRFYLSVCFKILLPVLNKYEMPKPILLFQFSNQVT